MPYPTVALIFAKYLDIIVSFMSGNGAPDSPASPDRFSGRGGVQPAGWARLYLGFAARNMGQASKYQYVTIQDLPNIFSHPEGPHYS